MEDDQTHMSPTYNHEGYSFGTQDAINWFQTPLGIATIVAIVALIAFLIWYFVLKDDKNGKRKSKGFKYY